MDLNNERTEDKSLPSNEQNLEKADITVPEGSSQTGQVDESVVPSAVPVQHTLEMVTTPEQTSDVMHKEEGAAATMDGKVLKSSGEENAAVKDGANANVLSEPKEPSGSVQAYNAALTAAPSTHASNSKITGTKSESKSRNAKKYTVTLDKDAVNSLPTFLKANNTPKDLENDNKLLREQAAEFRKLLTDAQSMGAKHRKALSSIKALAQSKSVLESSAILEIIDSIERPEKPSNHTSKTSKFNKGGSSKSYSTWPSENHSRQNKIDQSLRNKFTGSSKDGNTKENMVPENAHSENKSFKEIPRSANADANFNVRQKKRFHNLNKQNKDVPLVKEKVVSTSKTTSNASEDFEEGIRASLRNAATPDILKAAIQQARDAGLEYEARLGVKKLDKMAEGIERMYG